MNTQKEKAAQSRWLRKTRQAGWLLLCGLALGLASCSRPQPTDRVAQVEALEQEMVDFLHATLKENYGDENAVRLLAVGMLRYDFNYLLRVDAQRLKEINRKLYGADGLFDYFFERRCLADSCNIRLYVPEGMRTDDFRETEAYRAAMDEAKRRRSKGGYVDVRVISDSVLYAFERKQVRSATLPFRKQAAGGFSYWERELAHATHPALQQLRQTEMLVGIAPYAAVWGMLSSADSRLCRDFATDRSVQLYVALYLWNYLCHFANVDFHTGEDRTENVLEQARREAEYIIIGAADAPGTENLFSAERARG